MAQQVLVNSLAEDLNISGSIQSSLWTGPVLICMASKLYNVKSWIAGAIKGLLINIYCQSLAAVFVTNLSVVRVSCASYLLLLSGGLFNTDLFDAGSWVWSVTRSIRETYRDPNTTADLVWKFHDYSSSYFAVIQWQV